MIRRLYVDNFRSLVDFTWEPGQETLVLGYNGSGKTSALDALEIIRNWSLGWERLFQHLGPRSRCRFLDQDWMRFQLDLATGQEVFTYALAFRFSTVTEELVQVEESLESSKGGIFKRADQDLSLTPGHPDMSQLHQDSGIPLRQSAVSLLGAFREATFVHRFADALSSIVNVRPVSPLMRLQAERPESRPSRSFENFVAWYWNQTLSGAYTRAALGLLDEVWDDFDYLKFDQGGRVMLMGAVFKHSQDASREIAFDFDELSDGERTLILLYALVVYQRTQPPTTIIVDEPDNFVSLLEIQPWLLTMLDECPDEGQVILVSHNPEVIRTMGPEKVDYFWRQDHSQPTRVRNLLQEDRDTPLIDRYRRGWMDE